MIKVLIVILGCLVSTSSIAETSTNSLQLIPRLLAKSPISSDPVFVAKKDKKGWMVSFCPDNTCDVIRAPSATPANTIGDFSAIYLYYVSGYVYLKDFYTTDARPFMPNILERNSATCTGLSEFAQAACVLNDLAKKYSFKIATSI
jgi:hypothetical protein